MLPRFRRGAFALFALIFAISMLLGDRASIATATRVVPAEVLDGRNWWTPLSAAFRHGEGVGLFGLLWTLIIQWVIGSRLEGFWGLTRYLVMVLVASLVGYGGAVGLAAALPQLADVQLSGAATLDVAACTAFAWVFANERMRLGSREIPPLPLAASLGGLALAFPVLAGLVGGLPIGQAWLCAVPSVLAGVVATLFVQPWRKRENSGKVVPSKRSDHPHLRVVRTPEDMLN